MRHPARVCSRPAYISFTTLQGPDGPALLPARRFGPRRAEPGHRAAAGRVGRDRPLGLGDPRPPPRRRGDVLRRSRRPPVRHDRCAGVSRPDRLRPAVPPVLRGSRGRARPRIRPARRRRRRAPGHGLGARAAVRGRRARRRPAPAPPDPVERGGGPRRARRPDRRPPPRHRAADARGDRRGPAPLAVRGPVGEPAAPLGPAGDAADRPHRDRHRARRAAARHRPGSLRAGPQRLQPRPFRPAPPRARGAVDADALRGAARLGAGRDDGRLPRT